MKFKVSSQDFLLFVGFCVLLFYLCAIGVLNFSSFGNTGEFHGLSPFMAFTPQFLPATIVLFLVMLILIFTSVSGYIFNKEKGGGLGLVFGEKSEKGYSRWATEKEIKTDTDVEQVDPKDEETEAAGIPLINNGEKVYVDNGEYHNLVIGATGSGKTQCVVKPMVNLLAKNGESMIITDPKGEIYKYGADWLKSQGYKIIILNFREPEFGNAWNPLTLPYRLYKSGNTDKATELLDDVALNILYDPNNKGEPFWENSAADYFSGLALGLFYDAKEEAVNLNSISVMNTVGEEKFAASNYIKEYFNLKGENSSPYTFAAGTINAPAETKGGIVSVFRQKIRRFASRECLSEMLSYSDFDLRDIGKEKTAVFMIIHDEKTTYHSLATIFIKQCYECLIDEAQKNGGQLPIRTNFILDEFVNMPPLKDVDAMVTAARSRNIRFTFIIQNFGQLKDVYNEKAGTIKGNCGNLVYLISTEMSSLEEISKMAGEIKSGEKDKTASTPLITVTDLQKLKLFEAIIFRWRKPPFRTKYEPDFKMNWGIDRVMSDPPRRETKEIELFDLKEHVKSEKMKRNLEALENNKDGYPPGMELGPMGMGMNPMNPNVNPFAPRGGMGMGRMPSDLDIDAMLKNIDAKIAELDAEEERRKKELQETPELPKPDTSVQEEEKPVEIPAQEPEAVIEESKPIEEDTKTEEDKPIINVDADSVIVDEKIVTDDEFFDDFFGDDDE